MCLFNNSHYAWGMGGMGQRTNYYYKESQIINILSSG